MLETDYLANSLILLNAARYPELIQGDYNAALVRIAEVSGHADLYEIILFWRALQNWVRLLGLEDKDVNSVPARYREALLYSLDIQNPKALIECVNEFSGTIQRYLDEFLAGSELAKDKKLEEWEETPIEWVRDT